MHTHTHERAGRQAGWLVSRHAGTYMLCSRLADDGGADDEAKRAAGIRRDR